jgi:hypothetical protein
MHLSKDYYHWSKNNIFYIYLTPISSVPKKIWFDSYPRIWFEADQIKSCVLQFMIWFKSKNFWSVSNQIESDLQFTRIGSDQIGFDGSESDLTFFIIWKNAKIKRNAKTAFLGLWLVLVITEPYWSVLVSERFRLSDLLILKFW